MEECEVNGRYCIFDIELSGKPCGDTVFGTKNDDAFICNKLWSICGKLYGKQNQAFVSACSRTFSISDRR